MRIEEKLDSAIQDRLEFPKSVGEIPADVYLVYILMFNQNPIVVGHGKKNRAKIIFDSKETITSHIKALVTRLHIIFGGKDAVFERCIIRCKSKEESKQIEAQVHDKCGGNTLVLPAAIKTRGPTWMALQMAVCSSFDGIADLKKWRRAKILDDETWRQISKKLMIKYHGKAR